MRLLVFFDLPIETAAQRKAYRLFRKSLLKDGYLMMQESVYSKMVIDSQAADMAIKRLDKNAPRNGLVQVLRVTEKQYANIQDIVDERIVHEALDDMNRTIVL